MLLIHSTLKLTPRVSHFTAFIVHCYYHNYVHEQCYILPPHSKGKVRKAPTGGAGEFRKQSVKYTAQKLHEKGVILEIEGLPSHQ